MSLRDLIIPLYYTLFAVKKIGFMFHNLEIPHYPKTNELFSGDLGRLGPHWMERHQKLKPVFRTFGYGQNESYFIYLLKLYLCVEMFKNFGGECSTLGNYLMKVYLEKEEYYPEI